MENSWALILATLYIAAVAFTWKTLSKQPPKRKLPPGPKPWPVIGNLNLVGPIPHQSFHVLSQKYGEIMLLKFGKFPVIVASSPEMAKQFLKIHDTVFASRPELAAGKYMGYNYSDMVSSSYGPYWRQVRKIYKSEVFSARKMELFEHVRVEERRSFLARLRALSGEPVLLRDHISSYNLSTTTRMILSYNYFSESGEEGSILRMDELQGMLDEWFLLSGVFNIGDWIPWLSFLDLQGYVKKMKDLHKRLDGFLSYVVDDHRARRAGEKGLFGPKDVVDKLLEMAEDDNLEVPVTWDGAKALVQNLLVGGTDTSGTTVEWAIHELLRQPSIIEKAKEELDRVIGRNRWVEENDFSQLPYMEAIIMETLRIHPLATLLVQRYATEDINVAGYDISKGTMVLINTWSIGRDPNSWDAPEGFLPERFLGKEIDITGSNFAMLPFGSGRRRCPGLNLGLKMVRTTLANLLHGFELRLVQGMRGEDISMEEEYGLTTHPKEPLTIILEPRLPSCLY